MTCSSVGHAGHVDNTSQGFSLLFSPFSPKVSFTYLVYKGGCPSFQGTTFPYSVSECLRPTCKEKPCVSCGIAILNKQPQNKDLPQ